MCYNQVVLGFHLILEFCLVGGSYVVGNALLMTQRISETTIIIDCCDVNRLSKILTKHIGRSKLICLAFAAIGCNYGKTYPKGAAAVDLILLSILFW